MLPTPVNYMVLFKKGTNWNKSLPFKKQSQIGEHIIFIKKLYHNKKILMAGAFKDQSESFLILQGVSRDESLKTISQSPAIKNKVLNYNIKKVTMTMLGEPSAHKH